MEVKLISFDDAPKDYKEKIKSIVSKQIEVDYIKMGLELTAKDLKREVTNECEDYYFIQDKGIAYYFKLQRIY